MSRDPDPAHTPEALTDEERQPFSITALAKTPQQALRAMLAGAESLVKRAQEMEALPLMEQETVDYDEDGRPVTVIVKPVKWAAADIARNYKAAADLYEKIGQVMEQLPPEEDTLYAKHKTGGVMSERRLQGRERQIAALQLRLRGWTFDEIAEALGYADKSATYMAIQELLATQVAQNVEELRGVEVARLDELLKAVYPLAIGDNGHVRLEAVDRVLAIERQRANLLGLNAARKVDFRLVVERIAEDRGYSDEEKHQATAFVEEYLRNKRRANPAQHWTRQQERKQLQQPPTPTP